MEKYCLWGKIMMGGGRYEIKEIGSYFFGLSYLVRIVKMICSFKY